MFGSGPPDGREQDSGADSYSGTQSYSFVEKLIRNSKSVSIISPYIDEYYLNFLVASSRNRKISVISSSMDKRLADKVKKPMSVLNVMLPAAAVMAFDLFLFRIGIIFAYLLYALLGSAVIIAALVLIYAANRHAATCVSKNLTLKIPKQFVHAKMYIGDGVAIEGSANLTYAGMHRNVEHIRITRNQQEIAKLRHQFDSIWNSVD